MTRVGWLAVAGISVAIVGVILLVWGFARQSASYETSRDTIERTAELDPSELGLYSSGTYGFTFAYPASATIVSDFTAPSPGWRTNAPLDEGTLIVSVTTGAAEARVGMSGDRDALGECLDAQPGETAQAPVEANGTVWSVFTIDAIGTDNERRITSYRTVRGEACYALETFEPLAQLPSQETALPAASTPAGIGLVVQTFTFAR